MTEATHDDFPATLDSLLEGVLAGSVSQARLFAQIFDPVHGPRRELLAARRLTTLIADALAEAASRGWGLVGLQRWVRRRDEASAAKLLTSPVESEIGRIPYAVLRALAVVRILRSMPQLPDLGVYGRAVVTPGETEDKWLGKVRGLLAKAESTTFPEEAEALIAKAQQLITEHRLDATLLDESSGANPSVAARRVWLEDPYLSAKSHLLGAIAHSNDCQAIVQQALGVVVLIGDPRDVDLTELLFTSLLVQATHRMQVAASGVRRGSSSSTAAYKRSFLIAFAARIGQRLAEAAAHAVDEAVSREGDRLLPVLASRRDEVDRAVHDLFPRLKKQSVTLSDPAGYADGTAAADLADLAVHDQLPV